MNRALQIKWVEIAQWIDQWIRDQNVAGWIARQEGQENFLLQTSFSVLTVIWCPFHLLVSAVACKDPKLSGGSAGDTLDATNSEWANYAVQA